MKSDVPGVFVLYGSEDPLERELYRTLDRIGLSGTILTFNDPPGNQQDSRT